MGSLARQATINSLLSWTGIGLGFVNVVLLYPRVLQADEFGLTRLLVSIATVAAQIAQLGLDNTLIRYFPYFRDPTRAHRGLLGLSLLVGLAGALTVMLLLGLGHGSLTKIFSDRNGLYGTYGLWLLPLVLSEVFFIVLRAYSRSLRRSVQPTFVREFLLRVLQAAIIGAQALWHFPFGVFMAIYTSVFLLCTLALAVDMIRSGHWSPGFDQLWPRRRLRRSMFTYGAFTLSASLAAIVLGNLDQMMIGALLGDGLKYVAYYAVAYYFGSVIAVPSRSINQLAVPMLADAWRTRDMSTIGKLYRGSAMVQLVVGAFLFLLIWSCLDELFALLPPEYGQAREVTLVIAAANLFSIALGLNGGIISMSRSYRFDAATSLALLVVNAVAAFVFIRSMGIVGAAWATLTALVAVNLFRLYFLWTRHRLWPFTLRNLFALCVAGGTGLIVPWIPALDNVVLDVALRVGVITLLYWPAIFVLRIAPELELVWRPLLRRLGYAEEARP